MDGCVPTDLAFGQAWSEPAVMGPCDDGDHPALQERGAERLAAGASADGRAGRRSSAVFEMFDRRTVTGPAEYGREHVGFAGIREGELTRIGTSQAVPEAIAPVVQPTSALASVYPPEVVNLHCACIHYRLGA